MAADPTPVGTAPGPGGSGRRKPQGRARTGAQRNRALRVTPYLFAGAAALYLLLFIGVPLVQGLWLSMTETRLLDPSGGSFTGLDNFGAVLGGSVFWQSVLTTLLYSGLTVVSSLVLGTTAAVVINRAFPGRLLARTILTLPWAVPTVALVLVFQWIFNEGTGVANRMTGAIGLGEPGWLTDPDFGMAAVLIATVWKVTPFVMLVVLAALQSVPEELYEATRVDGSDAFSTFKAVVLPYLMPTLRIVALLMTIWSFRRFEIIWLLTGGGPADSTNTLVISVYREAFQYSDLGRAATIGVLGLLLSLVVTVVYFVMERRSANREGGH